MNLVDIFQLCDIPYPIFNDLIMKQIDENKIRKKKLDALREKQQQPRRK
jgi:hypothetical protein